MLLAVSFSGLVLTTVLVVDVYSICLLSRPCPCGTSGKTYMHCFETKFQQYSCESWLNCQTCEDYNQFCVTCPPGRFGLTCKNEEKTKSELSCKHPGIIENGIIDYQSETKQFPVGVKLRFLCREGYERVGPEAIHCLHNLSWSESPPVCKLISTASTFTSEPSCIHPGPIENGFIQNDVPEKQSFPLGSVLNFKCMEGHELIGETIIQCLSAGYWSEAPPICRPIPTKTRTKRDLKQQRGDTFSATGKECTFRITGNSSFNCRTDMDGKVSCDVTCNDKRQGTYNCFPGMGWDPILPNCEVPKEVKVKPQVSCKHPGVLENGIIEDFQPGTEKFPVGTKLRFICREGYEREGPEAIYCLRNFSWSGKLPVCKLILTTTVSTPTLEPSCKRPETIENGFIPNDVPEMNSYPVGSVLSFKCMEGYELIGTSVIHCLRSVDHLGYWSDIPPICRYISTATTSHPIEGVSCTNPGMVKNGIFENYPPESVSFPVGTELKFQCIEGYEMEGSKSIYCIIPGAWSESLPSCRLIPTTPVPEVYCGHPGMVANGTFEGMTHSRFPVGTPLTFRCRTGTRIEGPKKIYCLLTGKWSASPPICRPTRKEPEKTSRWTCKHPGMIENGVTEPSISKSEVFTVGKQLKFKCKEGYTIIGSDTIYCESASTWSPAPPVCRRSKNIPDCGRVFQELYKSNGKHTRSDWPWTVGLSTGSEDDIEKMFCGGALLNSRTVLTAAHCVTSAQNIKLHFGYRRPVSEQVRNISRIIMHPDYDDETHANDIALMKFDHHVYYDPRTQPICLPTPTLNSSGKNLLPGTTTFVAGYRLEFGTNQSATPAFKVFELPVQSQEVCEPVCRDQELVSCSPSTFCAGYLKDTKECIYGGTPLVVYHKERSRYTLEGLVTRADSARDSWNGKCKRAESYATFTNVTHFMPFILENLN